MASRKICVGFIHGENNQAPKGEKGETPKGRGEVKLLAGLRYSSEVGINERLTEMDPLALSPNVDHFLRMEGTAHGDTVTEDSDDVEAEFTQWRTSCITHVPSFRD